MIKIALSAILLAAIATPASAGIRCNDDYQVVGGKEIATPYCGDNNLANVARKYGIRVSNAEIRNNPNRKGDVCRMIGHDIRVKDACAGHGSSDRGNGR